MMYALGIAAFALCILASIAWHECGHMWAAQATGMKVRRYFIGFGPTLWSVRRPKTEDGIEYGVKALPLGGFCDIAGMTLLDELKTPVEQERAMYKQAAWKRLFVMFAGPGMNFILGALLIYGVAVTAGLPAMNTTPRAAIAATGCVADATTKPTKEQPSKPLGECRPSPAAQAGLQRGDVITSVNGKAVDADSVFDALQAASGPIALGIERDGQERAVTVDPLTSKKWRPTADGKDLTEVSGPTIGISVGTIGVIDHYNPITAFGGTAAFTVDLGKRTVVAIGQLPQKIPALVDAIKGEQRGLDTPQSLLGASMIGGEVAERDMWSVFFLLLAGLNLMLGLINLLPVPPFDGGHMAVIIFEKLRDLVTGRKGGPVDYMKLAPLTYVVLALAGGYMLLVLTADIVNPIKLFN
ncbi:M50 family metallopeptidase [Tsukamurella sp. NPDC003166]|uniref:M50 family metallopeptidase n=1 Tax=Tsukamurella sp. NPDC003166 TaxID=3154444 RepID=UPI0033B36BD6